MKYQLVYFPSDEALGVMAEELGVNGVLHAHQIGPHRGFQRNLLSYRRAWTACIDLRKPLDLLYNAMDSKSCRYMVRKAQKAADRIVVRANQAGAYRDFLKIHNDHARLKGHSGPISERVLESYLPSSDVFVLDFDSKAVCAHLVLRDPVLSSVRCIYLASRRLDQGADSAMIGALNRYLHWYSIGKYKRERFSLYDMGGLQDPKGPLGSYKLSFGGELVEDHSYWFGGRLAKLPHRVFGRFKSALMGRLEN